MYGDTTATVKPQECLDVCDFESKGAKRVTNQPLIAPPQAKPRLACDPAPSLSPEPTRALLYSMHLEIGATALADT